MASAAAVKFSKNMSKITRETYKAGADMYDSMQLVDWEGAKGAFNSFQGIMDQFGIFGELFAPFLKLFQVFDKLLLSEFSDVIVDLNQFLLSPEMIDNIRDLTAALRDFSDAAGEAAKEAPYGGGEGGTSEAGGWNWWDLFNSPQGGPYMGGVQVGGGGSRNTLKKLLEGRF